MLRAYGAEVVVCPTAVPPDHPDSYYSVSNRLVTEDRGRLEAGPVLQPERPGQPLRDHRPGDLGRHRRNRSPTSSPGSAPAEPSPVRGATSRRSRAGGSGSSAPTRRARCIPAVPVGPIWSRASARTSGRPPTTRRCPTRIIAVSDADSFDMTPPGPRGSPAGRRVVRDGRGGRAEGRRGRRTGRPGGRAAAGRWARLHVQDLQRRVDVVLRVSAYPLDHSLPEPNVGDVLRGSPARSPTWCTPTRRRRCATRSGSCASTGVADAGRRRRAAGDGRRGGRKRLGTRTAVGGLRGRAKLADAVSLHMSPPLPLIGAGEAGQCGGEGAARLGRRDGGGGGQAGRGDHAPRSARIPVEAPRRR